MPRWTQTREDQDHIAKVAREMPISAIVYITLINGKSFEGVLRRVNAGNNAGEGGWQYYGECEIESLDCKRRIIDYLDIEFVTNAWSDEKAAKYAEAGLITILK